VSVFREHPANRYCRVGEAGGAGEEVGGVDVGADCGWCHGAPFDTGEREDHEHETQRRDHLREQVRIRRAIGDRAFEGFRSAWEGYRVVVDGFRELERGAGAPGVCRVCARRFRCRGRVHSPDFEMRFQASHPLAGTFRGPRDATKAMAEWTQSFEGFSREAEEFIDADGDRVVVAFRERGRPRGGSIELDQRFRDPLHAARRQDRSHGVVRQHRGGARAARVQDQ